MVFPLRREAQGYPIRPLPTTLHAPREVAEQALAHTLGDKVEAAYRRGDLFDKRRRLMDGWASCCATAQPVGEGVRALRA